MIITQPRSHPQPVVLALVLSGQGEQQQVLLGRKLTGFGAGNIVAPGGKVDPGESALDAAVRELWEETALQVHPQDMQHRATVHFRFPARPLFDMDCEVFLAHIYSGVATASAELDAQWHYVSQLPTQSMWQDAQHWLPRIISGERFTATVIMAPDNLGVERVVSSDW